MLAVVLLLALLGTGLAAFTPSYAQAIDLSNPQLAFPAAARWASRLLGALLLLRASDGALHQVEHFLSVFRFRSTAVLVNVQGTFGRAGIKVGKALNDSIESENVVVRSDSSVVGFVAQVESECVGLLGNRSIVGLRSDSSVGQVRELIQQWFERFQAKGADIAGLDITSEKVTQMMRANIAIDAQRAGARTVAEIQAQRSTSELLVPKATPELLLGPVTDVSASTEQRSSTGNFSLGGAGMTDPNSVSMQTGTDAEMKVCPECAEPIRKAAVKCRFCNFRFDG